MSSKMSMSFFLQGLVHLKMKILSVFTHLEECFNQTDLKIFAMLRGEHSKNTEDLLARHRTPNHSFQAQWQKWLGVCPGFAV